MCNGCGEVPRIIKFRSAAGFYHASWEILRRCVYPSTEIAKFVHKDIYFFKSEFWTELCITGNTIWLTLLKAKYSINNFTQKADRFRCIWSSQNIWTSLSLQFKNVDSVKDIPWKKNEHDMSTPMSIIIFLHLTQFFFWHKEKEINLPTVAISCVFFLQES